MAAMWRNPSTRVSARAITYSRSPVKFAAPVLPASQSVVTPVEAHTGSVSIPRSWPAMKAWAWRSISPGAT